MSWNPSNQYRKVAEANRQYFATHADQYDTIETCVVSPRFQAMLQNDLDSVLGMISGWPGRQIWALDACGGSGNVALKLLDRGVTVTLCDLSPELLQIFESKCKDRGFSSEMVCQEIGEFLSTTDRRFDLIVFSSALHHIEDYTTTLKLASRCLSEGGYIYTVFDSIQWKFPAWQIIWLDYLFFKILNDLGDVLPAVKRKLKKWLRMQPWPRSTPCESTEVTELDFDTLVDYHVRRGIDDWALVDAMKELGLKVIWHNRYVDARYTPSRLLLSALGRTTHFKLLLQK